MKVQKEPSRNVTFRLPAEEYQRLEEQARGEGMSVGELARESTRAAIYHWGHQQELRALAEDTRGLGAQGRRILAQQRTIAIALLVAHGMSVEEARQWADENLNDPVDGRDWEASA